jgi:hypothetical protein
MPRKVEKEVALLILSSETARRIARMRSVGEHTLKGFQSVAVHDLYFDTPDGALGGKGNALRLRQYGSKLYLTVKGMSSRIGGRAMGRFESEEEWSHEALEAAMAILGTRDSFAQDFAALSPGADAATVLRRSGLLVVQDRAVLRRARDVVRRNDSEVLAELVIDEVTYTYDWGVCRLHEVEVELTEAKAPRLLDGIVQSLLSRYTNDLVEWPHSKLETGVILQRLAAAGRIDALLGQDRFLLPHAYPIIHQAAAGLL